ncbi:tryptophan-rich sensory protein [Staphylococcus equorum]|uniref:tryptophan-rich sensory protein n=1 Tax=Staphylococcus equorum TaxID=246432 RepID=UPI002DB66181|nr:tryptophan-rich sensory protein [Staphylococcus equorum]MEB7852899.1 tryptophan-rich sensory protein [Staphylococcus equorum]
MTRQRKVIDLYFIAFLIMIVMNYLNSGNIGNVAQDKQAIIQPAGFAFSIWGVIYVLILAWLIKLFVSNSKTSNLVNQLKYLPIINFLLNGLWIIVYTQKWILVSVIVIVALLYTIVKIYVILYKYQGFNRLPFSIYFGWVTLATIVNIFTLAVSNNIETILGLNELSWTIILLIVATVIGAFIAISFKDWLFPLVLIWPLYAIYSENNNDYLNLDITLLITSLVLIIISITTGVRKKKQVI